MKKDKCKRYREAGITLVELLGVIVILGILGFLIISVITSGLKARSQIEIEAALRDEADLIMAEVIADFYTLKASEIQAHHLPEGGSHHYYLELVDGSKLGFIDGRLQLRSGKPVSSMNQQIRIAESSKIELLDEDKALYRIRLVLVKEGRKQDNSLATESMVSIIQDK